MTDTTHRLALPFIAPGQAQKEMTHNEALARLDMLVQPVVEGIAPAAVPSAPALGQCWIVGVNAADAWAGHDGALACCTVGGWRFVTSFEGMSVWNRAQQMVATRIGGAWVSGEVNARQIKVDGVRVLTARQPAIARPLGGIAIDAEARTALNAIIATLAVHGLTAP
jgi:Protein of unknown function (DUF2793)